MRYRTTSRLRPGGPGAHGVLFCRLGVEPEVRPLSTLLTRPRQADDDLVEASLVDLLAASGAGDEQAFRVFYGRTRGHVRVLVHSLVRSPETTADVVQDVYAAAWQNAARYDPARGAVLAWLGTLARRKAIDRIRQLTRQASRDLAHARQHASDEPVDEVWEGVLRRVEAVRVLAALETLTPGKREVLRMTYLEGCTAVQIAERLGLPVGTVKTRRRDGLLMLRTLLQGA
ncbi:sigma-70 family RNA polymerase sigma factor [Friedmanniella luteola]|uniref:sigma-70 family RNA polymerase sigma factor n=1 Tax=Friedmanniella luteola TaxID=546871 RepID=UPI0012FD7051|nr:sigma-70 family RNA polymerase sigma factor [Friedmanniella luteola]